jgi:hypothetical protein
MSRQQTASFPFVNACGERMATHGVTFHIHPNVIEMVV